MYLSTGPGRQYRTVDTPPLRIPSHERGPDALTSDCVRDRAPMRTARWLSNVDDMWPWNENKSSHSRRKGHWLWQAIAVESADPFLIDGLAEGGTKPGHVGGQRWVN